MPNKIIRTLLLSGAMILITNSGSATQPQFSVSDLAGTYGIGSQYGGAGVTLEANGKFTRESGSHVTTVSESGTYLISNDVLRFTVRKAFVKRPGYANEVDLFGPAEREQYLGKEHSGDDHKEFSLRLVRWGKRAYLIYETECDRFAYAVNLGLEPRPDVNTRDYYGDFYLRRGDEQKDATGKPTLPEKSLLLLLNSPVVGTIVKIENVGRDRIATIDKGSRDGLKVGMPLVSVHADVFDTSKQTIVSLGEQTARVNVDAGIVFGDNLSSKYVNRVGYSR